MGQFNAQVKKINLTKVLSYMWYAVLTVLTRIKYLLYYLHVVQQNPTFEWTLLVFSLYLFILAINWNGNYNALPV